MNKTFFIKNQKIFQGENKLKEDKNDYFEGWYFKNTNDQEGVSFIPSISINNGKKQAFVQVITEKASYNIEYPYETFKYQHSPFFVQIGNNFFSENEVHIHIENENQNIKIEGELIYNNHNPIKTTKVSPNIMGPFSYLPFMECNHAIISMKHNIAGELHINNTHLKFDNGIGYMEKDWGSSFPKKYLWCQANHFSNNSCNFFLSIADIPLKKFCFNGFICVFQLDGKEHRFSTYQNSKIKKIEIKENLVFIVLQKRNEILEINCNNKNGFDLVAPVKGKMEKTIQETINTEISIAFKLNDKIIFSDKSSHCGLEIVR